MFFKNPISSHKYIFILGPEDETEKKSQKKPIVRLVDNIITTPSFQTTLPTLNLTQSTFCSTVIGNQSDVVN